MGCARRMTFSRVGSDEYVNLDLQPGSLLYMGGNTQDLWKHGIPPAIERNARINLTFRTIT